MTMKKAEQTERLVTLGLAIGVAKAEIFDRQTRLRALEDERDALMREINPAVWTSKGTTDPGPRFSI
ncbi:hypothetical protein LCGC14_0709560 [marine sediment metagenome]|uniref:Uncharacterized protein n=1 Tax=marine sediment metagenome TaxID=412755 RepID=A0A0F9QK53_9ZZZZ